MAEVLPAGSARGSNQSGMRAHNERLVLSLLRQHGALAKSDIARMTGLSAQTVSVIMRQLEADQLLVRGIAAETLAAARLLALWIGFTGPLLLAAPLAGLLLDLPAADLPLLLAALAAGALGLSALAIIAGAVTLGARGGSGLVALLVVPLAIPLLLFGSRPGAPGGLGLCLATALVLAAVAPFAGGAALRASRS